MITRYFEIETSEGKIWCAYDYIQENNESRPLVIIIPAYEKTARDSLSIASYLVLNGFNVLRFDARNSYGLSDGLMENYTLSSLTNDIDYVISYALRKIVRDNTLSIMAFSLSSRALFKYLAQKRDSSKKVLVAVSIVGVADVQYTVSQIINEDVFNGYLRGKKYGTKKLLTYNINYDNFIDNAISNQYHTIETTIIDANEITVPYFGSIMVSDDEWILPDHQIAVYNSLKNCRTEQFVISGASHKMWKNPRSAEIALKNSVKFILKYMKNTNIDIDEIIKPDITNVIKMNRNEREVILNWKMSS